MIDKTVMITIAGRPNVGKSTLANRIVGEKVSIVTNKPQTTRRRVAAVLNSGDTQLVFYDTPGFHKPRSKLGDHMVRAVHESVLDVDVVLLVVEPIANVGDIEKELLERCKQNSLPVILAINKIDTVKKEDILEVIKKYSEFTQFDGIIPISAKSGDGVDLLVDSLKKYAVPGPQLFPDGMVSDQHDEMICTEIVREKLLICLDKEIPHGTAVGVTKFSERDNEIIDLDVTIYCEKKSHKGIIIGKNGSMLKKIGELARNDIEQFMGTKVFLQTWVKVKENWRDSEYLLKSFDL